MRRRAAILAIVFLHLIFMQVVAAQARTGITPVAELTPLPLSQQLSTMREPIPVETILDAALGVLGRIGCGRRRGQGQAVRPAGQVPGRGGGHQRPGRPGGKGADIPPQEPVHELLGAADARGHRPRNGGLQLRFLRGALPDPRALRRAVRGRRPDDRPRLLLRPGGRPAARRGDDEPLRVQPGREEGVHGFFRQAHRLHLRAAGELPRQALHRGEGAPEPHPVQQGLGIHGRPLLP